MESALPSAGPGTGGLRPQVNHLTSAAANVPQRIVIVDHFIIPAPEIIADVPGVLVLVRLGRNEASPFLHPLGVQSARRDRLLRDIEDDALLATARDGAASKIGKTGLPSSTF